MVDMPNLQPQYAQVMIVQAAKQGAAKADRTLGVCQVIENPPVVPGSAVNSIDPIGWVKIYFSADEKRNIEGPGRVSVLRNPTHGTLTADDQGNYLYLPVSGYLGKDSATLLVEMGGLKIRVVYSFHVVKMINQDTEKLCPPSGVRKISLNLDDSNGDLISFQHLK